MGGRYFHREGISNIVPSIFHVEQIGALTVTTSSGAAVAKKKATLAVPSRKVQEYISLSYIRALCAQAGLNVQHWEWDDGVDMTVGSAKSGYLGCRVRNISFYLQIKATFNWKAKQGGINFRLKLDKFKELNAESDGPQYLVVYLMPRARAAWVGTDKERAVLRHGAYFVRLGNVKPVRSNASYAHVRVSLRNRLSAGELMEMYRHAVRRKGAMR